MGEINKCFCFSKTEFSALTMVYNIEQLVCFKEQVQSDIPAGQQIEEYNRAVFSLYKKAMLEASKDGLKVSEEVRKILSILKECHTVLTVESRREAVSGYCLYFGKSEDFIIMRPGTRNGEYVKAEKAEKKYLQQFLVESNIMLEETLSQNLLKYRKDFPVTGEKILNFLAEEGLKTSEVLWNIEEIETIMVMREPATGKEVACIGLLRQPMQDKIILIKGMETEVFPYSIKKTREVIEETLEEKDGIS